MSDASDYGTVGAMIANVPDIAPILAQAEAEGWTQEKFTMAVQNTAWWQTHADNLRQIINLQSTDKATYMRQLANHTSDVEAAATKLGVKLDFAVAQDIGYRGWIEGWSQDTLQQQIMQRGQLDVQNVNGSFVFSGQASQLVDQMQQMAQAYGVRSSQPAQVIDQWTKDIIAGNKTIDQYKDLMKANAISTYPGIRSAIESGYTVADIAQPYVDTYSQLLEVDPKTVDYQNTDLIKKALQGTGQQVDANGVPAQTPLWKFEQQVRSDPRWGYTSNARQATSQALLKVGTDMGFVS